MIIGIDGNEANVEKRVGIGQYSFELLRKFKELPISHFQFQIYLKKNPRSHMPHESENWKYTVLKPGMLWTQWRLPLELYLKSPKPNVFFSPSHYAPRFSPIPSVISIMDVSYLHFPELFKKSDYHQLTNWTAYSAKQAKKILTISKSSKNDIIKAYNLPSSKVEVIYPGIKEIVTLNPKIYTMSQLKSKYGIDGQYILFVGTLQPRKNISRLIEAFSKLDKNGLQLVIVGKRGWLYEDILNKPQELGIEKKVKFLDAISDEELSYLYKNAEFMVLPSLYEGFGLPVLEAMKYDCPVITSNVSSLPEAGGDACLYVDPENVDDITEKMQKLLGNEKLRKELIEKGRKQIKKFAWEKTALETLKVLEELGGANDR